MEIFKTYKWEDYLKEPKDERALTWIIDSHGVDWIYVDIQNKLGYSMEKYEAKPLSPHSTVTVVDQTPETKEISPNFYIDFLRLDFNHGEEEEKKKQVMDFMVSYDLDQAEYYRYDAVSGSQLFTIDHLRTYHQDFCDSAHFLIKKLKSSADELEEEVFQSIRKDKQSEGRSSGWGKDVRTILNDIEKHLKRCYFHLDYKKSSKGYLYYTDVKPADLIALAYYQLATKLSFPEKHRWQRCEECDHLFECSRANNRYCGKTCKRKSENRRYQTKQRKERLENPDKLKEVREKRNEYMREYRNL